MTALETNLNQRDARPRLRADCEPLAAVATKNLYRKNAFRLLGLSADATVREISKHGVKLKQLTELGLGPAGPALPFPLKPPASQDEIRAALQRLQDPEKRLVDEFFWFWPEEFGRSNLDPSILALQAGDTGTAMKLWGLKESDPVNGAVATHNLAVAWHLTALEFENYTAEAGGGEDGQTRLTGFWTDALRRWACLTRDETFWDRFQGRIRQLDDPRLTSGFAHRFRTSLPECIAKINGELALEYGEAAELERAKTHTHFMRQMDQGTLEVERAAQLVLAPAASRLREQISTAERCAGARVTDGAKASQELATQAAQAVAVFDLICGRQSRFRNDLFDEVAAACNKLLVAYDRATGDEESCIGILNVALAFTTFGSLRQQIEDNISVLTKKLESRGPPVRLGTGTPAPHSIKQSPEQSVTRVLLKHFAETTPDAVIARLKGLQDCTDIPAKQLASVKTSWLGKLECALSELPAETDAALKICTAACELLRAISLRAGERQEDLQTAINANELALRFAKTPRLRALLLEDKNSFRVETRASNHREGPAELPGTRARSGPGRPAAQGLKPSKEETVTRVLVKHFGERTLDAVIASLRSFEDQKRPPCEKFASVQALWLTRLESAVAELSNESEAYWTLCAVSCSVLRAISLQAGEKQRDLVTATSANEMAFRFAKTPDLWNLLKRDQETLRAATERSRKTLRLAQIAIGLILLVLFFYGFAFLVWQSSK